MKRGLVEIMLSARRTGLRVAQRLEGAGPLLVRLAVGMAFAVDGWGKLHALPDVTAYFSELGIPAPEFHATLVAVTEFAGGILVALGLLTRLVSIPLMLTMLVALITAKLPELDANENFLEHVRDVLAFDESLYLGVFAWLAVAGPGPLSLDHLLARGLSRLEARRQARHPTPTAGVAVRMRGT